MQKETENEETRIFCQIFVIGGISIEGVPGPWLLVRDPGAPWSLIRGPESLVVG